MSTKKFQLEHFVDEEGTVLLHHNLEPKITLQIIYDDDYAYDWTADVFDQINVNGVIVKGIVIRSEIDLDEIEDFSKIRKIIRRALFWYANQVFVRGRSFEAGPDENDRYILQESQKTDERWLLTDKENGIVISWDHGDFNESQNVTFIEDITPDVSAIARLLREAGDWLAVNHRDKI